MPLMSLTSNSESRALLLMAAISQVTRLYLNRWGQNCNQIANERFASRCYGGVLDNITMTRKARYIALYGIF